MDALPTYTHADGDIKKERDGYKSTAAECIEEKSFVFIALSNRTIVTTQHSTAK